MNTLESVEFIGVLAPRPGLEPGTYGLTERKSVDKVFEKPEFKGL
jgi:hypothetical protein